MNHNFISHKTGMLLPTWQCCWGFKETTYIKYLVGKVQAWRRMVEASWEGSGSAWPLALVKDEVHQKRRPLSQFSILLPVTSFPVLSATGNWLGEKCGRHVRGMTGSKAHSCSWVALERSLERTAAKLYQKARLENLLWIWTSGSVLSPQLKITQAYEQFPLSGI